MSQQINLDTLLRPANWDEYIGQNDTKRAIQVHLRASRERGHQPEHMLLYGPPGLGKTTLSMLIASEIGGQLKTTSGPALEKVGDVASMITNLQPGDILFVDEIHRLNKMIEEVLYPALERGVLDIMVGKGPSARTIQLDLPPFTLVAATTRIALLSAPLRARFSGGTYRLDPYNDNEMTHIITRSAKLLGITLDDGAISVLVGASRATPRTANYLIKRFRDYAEVHKTAYDEPSAVAALHMLGIDNRGLGKIDRDYLETLGTKFSGGPTGIKTMAAAMDEDEGTLEDVIEPYLMRLGFIERTARGRELTDHGRGHIS
jgi:Holliday junction DNA helicase RuvB